ncbi:hypothetical protein [Nocardioides sp. B-3]|nr:hypothetical protein [Nocardioides sp. B-3]UUZ58066.1 hypothetical protein LP418_17415 [Nocardioides sp. B-3]
MPGLFVRRPGGVAPAGAPACRVHGGCRAPRDSRSDAAPDLESDRD